MFLFRQIVKLELQSLIILFILYFINPHCMANIETISILTEYPNIKSYKEGDREAENCFADAFFLDQEDKKVTLEEIDKKILLVTFCSEWDPGSIIELLKLDILQKDFSKLSFKIIPITNDFRGIKPIINFYKQADIKHLSIFYDKNSTIYTKLGLSGLPITFLIDKDSNKIKYKFIGNIPWEKNDIRQFIFSQLQEGHQIKQEDLPRNSSNEQLLQSKIKQYKILP